MHGVLASGMMAYWTLGPLAGTWQKNGQETDAPVTYALSRPSTGSGSLALAVHAGNERGPDRRIAAELTVDRAIELRDELDAAIADACAARDHTQRQSSR